MNNNEVELSNTPMEQRINQTILDGEEWIIKNIDHPMTSLSDKIQMIKTLELSRMGDWIRDIDIQLTELSESIEYNLSEIKDSLQIINSSIPFQKKPLEIKFKKLSPEALPPRKATPGACCFDIVGVKEEFIDDHTIRWHTGLALEIPYGYKGNIYSRSSVYKTDSFLINGVGKIDSDFRGEVCFIFHVFNKDLRRDGYKPGDRIGQLEIERDELVEFVESQGLSETSRGEGGFGSTGK